MEHELIFHDDYLEIRAWGEASLQGFIDYLRDALQRPEWRQGMNVLSDLTELEGHDTDNISFDDTSTYATFIAKNIERIGNVRSAIIPGMNFDSKVLVSLYDSLTKYYGIPVNQKIVSSRAEALTWFTEDQAFH